MYIQEKGLNFSSEYVTLANIDLARSIVTNTVMTILFICLSQEEALHESNFLNDISKIDFSIFNEI